LVSRHNDHEADTHIEGPEHLVILKTCFSLEDIEYGRDRPGVPPNYHGTRLRDNPRDIPDKSASCNVSVADTATRFSNSRIGDVDRGRLEKSSPRSLLGTADQGVCLPLQKNLRTRLSVTRMPETPPQCVAGPYGAVRNEFIYDPHAKAGEIDSPD
jgi:hypothetical protein